MRILLLAYAFPPLATPQALRWHYLTRELAARGHDVHVLAPDLVVAASESIEVPPGVTVHRCSAGGLTAQIHHYRRRRQNASCAPEPAFDSMERTDVQPGLNWKGRLHRHIDIGLGYFMYPDATSQWLPPARACLRRLLPRLRPDVLVASHEPAGVLQLALDARGDTPWIADLGDPVLADYTPMRWHRRAFALESRVMHEAAHIVVTTEATRTRLLRRHRPDASRISVVSQGFDAANPPATRASSTSDALELFYGGRFYAFRDPGALIEAVQRVPGVRLRIASPEISDDVLALCATHPSRIELLGCLSHQDTLHAQRSHDALVNIGNRAIEQTPGKLYEYFGACRPILHLSSTPSDPAEELVARHARGWSCANHVEAIAEQLRQLLERKRAGQLDAHLDLSLAGVATYQWQAQAERIEFALHQAATEPAMALKPAIA